MRKDHSVADGVDFAFSYRTTGIRALLALFKGSSFCRFFVRLSDNECIVPVMLRANALLGAARAYSFAKAARV